MLEARSTLTGNADGEDIVYPLLKNKVVETQGLIAIMAQWGLTAEELLPTIDKINLTADNYAVSSEDLVAGLTRSSGAAKVLGLTLDETIGILTVMREATGRTGKEVGNALNSILSFMQRPTAIKAFEAEGIRVFADEARTQFRNVIEIFDEMSAKWPTMSVEAQDIFSEQAEQVGLYSEEMAEAIGLQKEWTDIQQRDLSQAAAGIYRRNYLLALLQNWAKVDEVIVGLEDSLGYSMKENERTMATLEKQIQSLKAAAEQFAVAIGDAGLLDQMKGIVEGTTDVIKWFNDLDDTTKTLLVTFGEVAIAIKLLTSLMKMMGLSGAGALAGGLLKGWSMPVKLAEASKAMIALRTATTATTTALRNLGTGAVAALGGPWVLGITAAAAAVYTLYKEVKAANATMIEHGVLAENMVGDYDALVNKLSQLEKGTEDYNKTAEELRVQKEQISKALPEVVDGYDAETNSLIINRKAMDDVIDAGKEMKKSLDEKNKSLENAIELEDEEIQASQSRAREWESQKNILEELAQRRKDLIDVLARQAKGSEDAQKTEEALGETEKLIADIAVEAGLKRNASVDEIIGKISELIKAQNDAAIKHYNNQRKMVEDARQGALDRLEILNQEIAANKSLLPGGQWYQYRPVFLKGKYNILPGGEFWARQNLKESQEALIRAKADLDKYNRQLAEIDKSVQSIKNAGNKSAAAALTGGGPSPGPGAAAKGAGKEIDYLAEAIQRLTDAAKQYELVNMDLESVLDAVNRRLGVSNAEYDYLNGKVEAGTATAQDYARMQELLARKTALLKNEQVQLANANQEYQRQIDSLTPVLAKATAEYDRFRAAGDEKHMKDAASAVSALKSEIDSLSGAIASNTQQLWENQGALDQLATSAYTAYYQQTMAWMSHMDAIGKMNSELQSQVLAGFDVQKLTLQDLQDLEKRQFNDRLDRLKTERDRITDAYDARMKQYEAEIEANDRLIESKEKQAEVAVDGIEEQIKAIQRLMDLLDDDAESEDREEAERKHNKKLAELAEERLYHELRTGLEHQDRIKEIDDETAEEKRRWQLQQNDWARKDQKDAYQDQINALKEKQKAIEKSSREEINQLKKQNDRKKQEMQRFYNELNSILNDSNLRMMAASQERGKEFIRKMGEIARQATQAFNDNYRPDSVISGARDLVDDARSGYTPGSGGSSKRPSESDYTGGSGGKKLKAIVGPESYTNKNGRTYMWSQNLAGLLGYSATWNQSDGTVTIGGKKFTPAWNDNGRTFLGIREVAEKLGFSTTYDNSSREVSVWDKAHTGAKVKTTGIAELMHDERVLSPNLTVSFDKLAAVLSRPTAQAQIGSLGSSADLEKIADRVIAAIERKKSMQIDKLLNIEHAGFEDRADMQALGVEVRNMLTAVGR